MAKVAFPTFREDGYTAYEMRQLVSALEFRFQALEASSDSLFDTGDTDDLDNRYSQLGHTHTESEISDLQNYLTDITAESIFDLTDVEGTPQDNWVLVWSDAQDAFVVEAPGAAGAVALNDLSNVSVPAPIDEDVLTWDQGSGQWIASAIASGGVNTLVDLLDTDVSAQLQYDLLFNADGSEWQPTGQDFQWFPGQYLQLGNTTAINWYDAVAASVEHLAFVNTVVGAPPASDPDIGSVTLLVSAETADVGAGTFTADIGGVGWTYSGTPTSGVEQGHISDASFKHGAKSVYVLGATGATFEGLVGPEANSTEAAVFFPIGLQEFTIEWWIDPSTENVELNPDGRWSNPKEIISSHNTQQPSAEAIHILILSDGDLEFWTPVSGGRDITFSQVPNGLGSLPTTWMNEGWTHWAITRESDGEFRAWCQGVLQGTTGIGPYPSRSTLSLIQPTNTQTVNFGCSQRNGQVPNGGASAAYIDDVRITLGVARYTTAGGNFTPPGPLDGTIGEEAFIVGDPGYATQIDGTTTTITGDAVVNGATQLDTTLAVAGATTIAGATQLDTTLDVDGISTLNNDLVLTTTLDDATGDEVAFALNYTTNKASSGADTGFQMTMIDTLSPGTSLFADYILGVTTLFDWGIDGTFRQYDLTGVDTVAWSHDGTDFNTTLTGTTDWNITGAERYVFDEDLLITAGGYVTTGSLEAMGSVGLSCFMDAQVGYARVGAYDWNTLLFDDMRITADNIDLYTGTAGTTQALTVTSALITNRLATDIANGVAFRILDSTNADSASFTHDGTDFNMVFANTADWNITGHTGSVAFDNILAVRSLDNTDAGDRRLEFQYQDGTLTGSVSAETQFTMRSYIHGAPLQFVAEDGAGNLRTIMTGDPDSDTILRGDLNITLQAAAGTQNVLRYTAANGYTELFESGNLAARTRAATLGGFEVDNQATSTGIERVMTVADQEAGQPVMRHAFSGTTTSGDPGSGTLRFNNATMASVTAAYISTTSDSGITARSVLDHLADGDAIYFGDEEDRADYLIASVNGTPTDNTTWYSIPLTVIGSGTQPSGLEVINSTVNWLSAASGLADGTVTNASLRWTGSAWAEENEVQILANGSQRWYDTAVTNYMEFNHSGAFLNANFSGTSRFLFNGLTDAVEVRDGAELRVYTGDDLAEAWSVDPGATSGAATHMGVSGNLLVNQGAAGQWSFREGSQDKVTINHNNDRLEIHDGYLIRIMDSGDTDWVELQHDGTDLLITETNTTDIAFPAAGTLGLRMEDNVLDQPILQDHATQTDAPTVSANAVTLDYTVGPTFEVDLEPATATVAVTISGGPPSGTYGRITVKIQQDGATAQTLTWAGGTFRWDGGTAHPMNTTLDGISIYTFETWDGGTTWDGSGFDSS